VTTIVIVVLVLQVPVFAIVAMAPQGSRHRALLAAVVGPDIALALRTPMRCDRKHRIVTHPDGWSVAADSADDYRWMCKRLLLDGELPLRPSA
jgi:hypothetical protein